MKTEQRRTNSLVGKVISTKMDKTIVVLVIRKEKHPVYKKYITKSTKLHVHDEENACRINDIVKIEETRPLAKTKNWTMVEILERAI